jgi:predicted esterase
MIKNLLENFVFFPDKNVIQNPSDYQLPYEDIFLNKESSSTLFEKYHGWFIPAIDSKEDKNILKNFVLILFHGNAGNVSHRLPFLKKLYTLGLSILIFDYPGFGKSDGHPNEENCIQSGTLFIRFLKEKKNYSFNQMIFYGESIGGSIATSCSDLYKNNYLIIQSSFTDIKEIIQNVAKIPTFILQMIGFNTIHLLKKRKKISRMNKNIKTLIIHSQEDELIPFHHGKRLSKYADHLFICKGKHSSPQLDYEFLKNIFEFILK